VSLRLLTLSVLIAGALAACGGHGRNGVCSNRDGALTRAAFVFVQSPASGERVSSGFEVSGCSSTFESTVGWRLLARSGRVLARGSAQGGGLHPGPFAFSVDYSVRGRQIGRLEVFEPRVTSEGHPPVTNALPLVLGA